MSPAAFTMMFSNSAGSLSRPTARTLTCRLWPAGAGCWPTWPAATCTFCSRSAATTSEALSPRLATRTGSSQSRMAYRRSPKMNTSATPFTRLSASWT